MGDADLKPETEADGLKLPVFLCGGAVMVLELVGTRFVAPFLGTSVYVWTSLIGVVLAALSFGGWWGGHIADRRPERSILAGIVLAAGLFTALIVPLGDFLLDAVGRAPVDLRLRAFASAVALFAPPALLLGMVCPFAVRLKLKGVSRAGREVGWLYGISTAGSIAGTFLAGFILFSYVGSSRILIFLAALLVFAAWLIAGRWRNTAGALMLCLSCGLGAAGWSASGAARGVLADVDTRYSHVHIVDAVDSRTKRPIRKMINDPYGAHGAIFLDAAGRDGFNPFHLMEERLGAEEDELVYDCAKVFRLSGHFVPGLRTALMIGGGVYTYPREFLRSFPEASLDVVELDAELALLAVKYFGLVEDPRLKLVFEDGRVFLNRVKQRYDVVLMDAFNSAYAVPFQLTSLEAVKRIYDILSDKGAVLVNLVSAIEGSAGRFLQAEYATYKEIFPQVYVFPLSRPEEGAARQDVLLVALKSGVEPAMQSSEPRIDTFLRRLWKEPIAPARVLTDDHAPVEFFAAAALP